MLAGKVESVEALVYPLLASPKLDGVRCLIINGQAVSRNLKPIPNGAVRDMLSGLPAMDGELVVGPPNARDAFNRTSSGVMSRDGIPLFMFYVFDCLTNVPYPFHARMQLANSYTNSCNPNYVQFLEHVEITTPAELLEYEKAALDLGYEGVMVRSPTGPYKHGRSTLKEGYLLKLKRFEDAEAIVIGFEEKEHNDNPQTQDELGRAKRSSHKANKRGANTLGALVVRCAATEQEFNIGTGFSEAERADIWSRRSGRGSFLGRTVKYRYQPTGVKDKPRFPTFIGWRDAADS
jgi:DNA ligase-1